MRQNPFSVWFESVGLMTAPFYDNNYQDLESFMEKERTVYCLIAVAILFVADCILLGFM